jgi:hypothetical protein
MLVFHPLLVETPENAPYKVGTLVMVRNLKKSLKKSDMEYDFLGPFRIKNLHSNGKVDLAHPDDKTLSVIKEYRNVPISMLKLAQVGEISTEEDLTKLDEERGVYLVKIDEISTNSTGNVMIIIN